MKEQYREISVELVAKMAGLKKRQIQRLAAEGEIPSTAKHQNGYHRIYFDTPELRAWAKNKRLKKGKQKKEKREVPPFPIQSLRRWDSKTAGVSFNDFDFYEMLEASAFIHDLWGELEEIISAHHATITAKTLNSLSLKPGTDELQSFKRAYLEHYNRMQKKGVPRDEQEPSPTELTRIVRETRIDLKRTQDK